MFAMSLALMATRGWSFRSWRAYPKYGSTAVVRAALARRAARGGEPVHVPRVHAVQRARLAAPTHATGAPDPERPGDGVEDEHYQGRTSGAADAQAPRRTQRPRGVGLCRRGEARGGHGTVLLEQPGDRARVRRSALQLPGLAGALQRVAVLPALDRDQRDAVRLDRGDALVTPVVHRAICQRRQPAAPQVHVAVAGPAHVRARVLRAPGSDDQPEERSAAVPDADPPPGRAVHVEPA